jgi:hypothetical protein
MEPLRLAPADMKNHAPMTIVVYRAADPGSIPRRPRSVVVMS